MPSKKRSTKPQAIPRSKAKTAWGLLEDVKKAIRAEPKRADMTTFGARRPPTDGGPACGTVGCVAGWIALLGRTDAVVTSVATMARYAESRAVRLMGGHRDKWGCVEGDVDFMTVDGGRYVFNAGDGDACTWTLPGTKAHASAVIARITKFQRMNEPALKAKALR